MTWISRPRGDAAGAVRVAVKDAIDVAGLITTAGCAAVRERAFPAPADARCVAGVRAAGAFLAGKTTLTELCLGPYGLNPSFGNPINPAAPDRIPGGSSSGSAVAVALGDADIGLGTDTGGSVRIPAACCGIVGLKTTWGRIPLDGVWPLDPSLDTVGPLARDVAGVTAGMRLLEPGWTAAPHPARVVGRLRIDASSPASSPASSLAASPAASPAVEEAVDAALASAGLTVREIRLPGWGRTWAAIDAIILGELWRAHHTLLDAEGVGAFANDALHAGRAVTDDRLASAQSARLAWQAEVMAAFDEVELLALPTLIAPPPLLTAYEGFPATRLTAPFNLAGVPALAMPIPSPGFPVPPSLQLVGPLGGEDLLCTTARTIESALIRRR